MSVLKCYLAGDISPDRWRLQVVKQCQDCQIEWLSPVDNVSYSHQSLLRFHRKNRGFHICDKLKIDRADIIFAYLKEGSPSVFSGTSWELGYAHANQKHTVLVLDMKPSKACLYELVKRMADACYSSLEDGIDHLREMALEMSYLPKEE